MRIILVGFGAVGKATVQLLGHQRARLARQYGLHPRIVAVVTSRGAAMGVRELEPSELLQGELRWLEGTSALEVIEQVEAEVVVEAAPTELANPAPALERLQTAFRTGKHAISVNKAPLAVAMPPLLELAEHNRVFFRFSGTVGGGTPFLDWAERCARGDEVLRLRGVLNATTNYILTRMRSGLDFDTALKEAQEKGYAEADPSMDIDGIDTAIKLVILANAVLDRKAVIGDVSVQGIRDIADSASVRLVGSVEEELRVAPVAVPPGSPLDVSGTLNAVSLELRHGGAMTLCGRGAGGVETATSIVRDLLWIWHEHWERR